VRRNKWRMQIFQNYELRIFFSPNIIVAINSRKIGYAGHVAYMISMRRTNIMKKEWEDI
jgi:hypothetical protein